MKNRVKGFVLAGGLLAAVQAYAPAAEAQRRAILVLLDRSGSMFEDGECRGSGIQRKWDCGTESALTWLGGIDTAGAANYFVWQLSSLAPDGIAFKDGSLSDPLTRDEALTLIGALPGPPSNDSNTPLAGAFCDAIRLLRDYREQELAFNMELHLRLESDGLENSTPDLHDCFGTDSGTDGPDFTPGNLPVTYDFTEDPGRVNGLLLDSWQSKMYDFVLTAEAHAPYTPNAALDQATAFVPNGSPVLFNFTVDFIEDFIDSGLSASARRGGGDGSGIAASRAALAAAAGPSTIEDFVAFLDGLTRATPGGGRLTRFGSGTLPPAGHPHAFHEVPSDVNDDNCVNSADFAFIQARYGQIVSPALPDTYRADVNLDGRVTSEDYLLLTQHYGEGCSTPPGPLPQLGAALLGFEYKPNWSSPQTAVVLDAVNHTEGTFSMKVGATGWRELKSVSFQSSQFGPVKAKLAYDIYIPKTTVNPGWLGQTLAFISIPSANINNLALGAVELTGKPKGAFTTATFNLPQNVRTAIGQNRATTLRLVVNSSDTGHLFDKIRLVP
jgi:hypothetical protein